MKEFCKKCCWIETDPGHYYDDDSLIEGWYCTSCSRYSDECLVITSNGKSFIAYRFKYNII